MGKFKILFKLIKDPKKIIRVLGNNNCFNWIPDKLYLKLVYWGETGEYLNLDNPQTFNEKLQWIKLYDRKPEYSSYVDKYEVRKHIATTIGEEYLIPLIGVYESVDAIQWDALPNQFVLKCTHGSGSNIICQDKNKLDIKNAKKKLNKWMKKNWFWFGREWPYKNIIPRIICEEFISDKDITPDDYKVLCFHGNAKLIGVHIDRFGNHCLDNYDREWNKTTIAKDGPVSNFIYDKPKCFENMITFSEKLASNMYHLRVDWYIVKDKLYFGEITFFEAAGFEHFDNKDDHYLLGSWINLPVEKEKELCKYL